MGSVDEMAQFVELWDYAQNIQLNDQPDQIRWNWTANGEYSSKSAYLAQFYGSYSTFRSGNIWKAETEGKHKFFAWLLIQSRILTADNLLMRGCPCNPVCIMCDQEIEMPEHLILHCSFARQVWQAIAVWTGGLILTPDAGVQLMDWWEKALSQLPKKIRKLKASVMIYGAWNIWKARNRRVFDQKVLTPVDVLHEVQMEMKCRSLACGGPELSFSNNV